MSLWKTSPIEISATDSFLHIFRFPLSRPDDDQLFRQLLSTDELQRLARLVMPDKQNQFLLSRGLLRKILSFYLKKDPASICFKVTLSGKPSLAYAPFPLYFNVSHSDQFGVVAVASTMVGIDIERIKDRLDFPRIGALYFNRAEQDILNNYPAHRKRRGFYRLWTNKEARLKMLGCGFIEPDAQMPENAFQHYFYVAPGYVASVAMNAAPDKIARFNLLQSNII